MFFFFSYMNKNCLSSQLVPELIDAEARVYIKKKRNKNEVIIYSKITKGTIKTTETATGNRKSGNSGNNVLFFQVWLW